MILASYVWSDEANRWDSMGANERYQVALDGLAAIYGNGIKRFYTGSGQTQSWMQDPYVMGEVFVFLYLFIAKYALTTNVLGSSV